MVGMVVGKKLRYLFFCSGKVLILVSDIVVVGNKITVRNASFRLPISSPTHHKLELIPLPFLTNAVVPSCHSLVSPLLGYISLVLIDVGYSRFPMRQKPEAKDKRPPVRRPQEDRFVLGVILCSC